MLTWFFKHPIFTAIGRNLFSILLLLVVGNLFVHLAEFFPQTWGEWGAPLLRGFGYVCIGVAVAKLMYAIIDPHAKTRELFEAVMIDRNVAAGLALIARAIIVGVIVIMTCSASRAAELPVVAACMPAMKDRSLDEDHYAASAPVKATSATQIQHDLGPCSDPRHASCCTPRPILKLAAAALPAPPPQALPVLPILKEEQKAYWPTMTMPSYLAAQIEQETGPCPSRKSCWNSAAELKTCREQGVGYYQLTRAYTAGCLVVRFDTLTETVNHYPTELKGLSWTHWNDPRLQLRAGILKSRDMAKKITGAKDLQNQLAFLASAWNGGLNGLSNDRLSCRAVKGCDASVWFGNVELHSLKSKSDIPGYGHGQNPFNINRTYVKNLFFIFRPKYARLDSDV